VKVQYCTLSASSMQTLLHNPLRHADGSALAENIQCDHAKLSPRAVEMPALSAAASRSAARSATASPCAAATSRVSSAHTASADAASAAASALVRSAVAA